MGRLTKRLLPTREILARKYTVVYDDFNYPQEHYTEFYLEDANYQPETGVDSTPTTEGYRDSKIYTVYTSTSLTVTEEGNFPEGTKYQVFVEGVWCDVIATKPWSYGVQSHNWLKVAQRNER